MDKDEISKLIKWKQSVGASYHDIMEDFINPLMLAFGDDINVIIEYLNALSKKDLKTVSCAFEDIYAKFNTEEVWDMLEEIEGAMDD